MRKKCRYFILKGTVFTILLLSVQVYGQKIMMGPTVGLNVSTITFKDNIYDPSEYFGDIMGLRAGLQMEFNAGQFFSLLTEASYSRQGIAYGYENDVYKGLYSYYIPYLSIAVMPKLTFGNNPLKAFLSGGVYSGHMIGMRKEERDYNKITQEEDVYKYRYTNREIQEDGFNRFDFGLTAAFGAEKLLPLGKISFMIGYRAGLTNFFSKKYLEEAAEDGEYIGLVKNKVFTVQASYLFPLYKPTR